MVTYGGLLVGRHISNLNAPLSPQEQRILEQKRAEKLASKEKKRLEKELKKIKDKADYIAAPSSYGPFIKVQKVKVKYNGDEATAMIEKELATDIKAKQRVILYDKKNKDTAMPLGGVVQSNNSKDGKRKVVIALPDGTNTDYLSDTVGVITLQTINSQRFPLSALKENKEGDSIIWLARQTHAQNGKIQFKMEAHRIEKADKNGQFFTPKERTVGPYDLVVTNPDKFIRADNNYDLFVTKLDTPTLNPIDQAKVDFDVYVFETRQAQLIQAAEDCANGRPKDGSTTLVDGSTSVIKTCGANPNQNDVMFNVFQSLKETNSRPGSGACSQTASSCGQ